ncbi:MAG: hypothetical protein J2P36_20025, partial [Ktedonobacteraceae bacterium]|nr:hypothetical protein [Ktedonobacteraceae bacterium]
MVFHSHTLKRGTDRLFKAMIVLGMAGMVMLLAACGGNPPSTTTPRATTLRLVTSPAQTNKDLFAPYFNTNQGGAYGAQGLLYEPLFFTNLYNGETQPWLATSYKYSDDLTKLT